MKFSLAHIILIIYLGVLVGYLVAGLIMTLLFPPEPSKDLTEKINEGKKKVSQHLIKTLYSGWPNADILFGLAIGNPSWSIGFILHEWGIRFLLGGWQLCFHKDG